MTNNENSKIIRTTYNHPDYGTLRVVFDGTDIYYCARDITRILEIGGHDTVNDLCSKVVKQVHETNGGIHVMNFIPFNDVYRLYLHSRRPGKDAFLKSLHNLEDEFYGDLLSESNEKEELYEDGHDEKYLELLEKIGCKPDENADELTDDVMDDILLSFVDILCDFAELLLGFVGD